MARASNLYRSFRLTLDMDEWLADTDNAPEGASKFIREAVRTAIRKLDPTFDDT